jgi:hypothetical protein
VFEDENFGQRVITSPTGVMGPVYLGLLSPMSPTYVMRRRFVRWQRTWLHPGMFWHPPVAGRSRSRQLRLDPAQCAPRGVQPPAGQRHVSRMVGHSPTLRPVFASGTTTVSLGCGGAVRTRRYHRPMRKALGFITTALRVLAAIVAGRAAGPSVKDPLRKTRVLSGSPFEELADNVIRMDVKRAEERRAGSQQRWPQEPR